VPLYTAEHVAEEMRRIQHYHPDARPEVRVFRPDIPTREQLAPIFSEYTIMCWNETASSNEAQRIHKLLLGRFIASQSPTPQWTFQGTWTRWEMRIIDKMMCKMPLPLQFDKHMLFQLHTTNHYSELVARYHDDRDDASISLPGPKTITSVKQFAQDAAEFLTHLLSSDQEKG